MAIDKTFVEYVVDQIGSSASYRMMFGAFSLYSNNKVVGIVHDNQLFVKMTDAGRAFIGKATEAPPYPGAKQFFLIGDEMDDSDWLAEFIQLTERELPAPKPRKRSITKKKKK